MRRAETNRIFWAYILYCRVEEVRNSELLPPPLMSNAVIEECRSGRPGVPWFACCFVFEATNELPEVLPTFLDPPSIRHAFRKRERQREEQRAARHTANANHYLSAFSYLSVLIRIELRDIRHSRHEGAAICEEGRGCSQYLAQNSGFFFHRF